MLSRNDAEILKEAIDYANKLMEKPDVPKDSIYQLMNRLAAISLRLRYKSAELNAMSEKLEAKRYESVARSVEEIIKTLKIQARAYQNQIGGS